MMCFLQLKVKKMMVIILLLNRLKEKHHLAIVNKIQNRININRQIKVKDTLKFLTEVSKIYRKVIDTKIICNYR